MRIELKTKNQNSDFDGEVIDIYYHDIEESFDIGIIFERIVNLKLKCWRGNGFIRIPLTEDTPKIIDIEESNENDIVENLKNKEKIFENMKNKMVKTMLTNEF